MSHLSHYASLLKLYDDSLDTGEWTERPGHVLVSQLVDSYDKLTVTEKMAVRRLQEDRYVKRLNAKV